jgi:E3 ubiquitin-protein ligase BRE1
MQIDKHTNFEKTHQILRNIVIAIDNLWDLKDRLYDKVVKALPEESLCGEKRDGNLEKEVKNLRVAIGDLHLKHKTLARELQTHWDSDAKNKARLKRLRGELESTIADLEESNRSLASLKAEQDAAKEAFLPVFVGNNKHFANDKPRDKQKDLHDMESTLKKLLDHASSRLLEVKRLYEERIELLKQLSNLQNTLRNVKGISTSQAYMLVKDQISKAKEDLKHYQALYEKLKVEKDNLVWREKESIIKTDIYEVFHQFSSIADTRIAELGIEIQKQTKERKLIESKLEEASREPGRKEIIAEFKVLVSSFPEDMGRMQSQLSKYKEAASDVHSLRADVQSLSSVLDCKTKELETLSTRSNDQVTEIQKLQAVVHDLKESDLELKLILEMYRRESIDSRDLLEARDAEFRAWAQVQTLNSSLDEHKLELRVKTAIEAEAISQQRLAAAEAEIADLRRKWEASKREKSKLSDVLKSKHEENEAYLSEIETIGQAYDDIQTQNQHLLQQITERDDYNVKLVLEGVRARQVADSHNMEKRRMSRAIEQGTSSVAFCETKGSRIDEQVKLCSEQVEKLQEDRSQSTVNFEHAQKKLSDIRRSSPHVRDLLDASQLKLDKSRTTLADVQIQLEKERFEKKRVEEELQGVKRKASSLKSQIDGSSVLQKLKEELKEYRGIVKCRICLERPKEVVITKCYHLFCSRCVQKVLETRHRKCPVCAASFGANDVKPVYI